MTELERLRKENEIMRRLLREIEFNAPKSDPRENLTSVRHAHMAYGFYFAAQTIKRTWGMLETLQAIDSVPALVLGEPCPVCGCDVQETRDGAIGCQMCGNIEAWEEMQAEDTQAGSTPEQLLTRLRAKTEAMADKIYGKRQAAADSLNAEASGERGES